MKVRSHPSSPSSPPSRPNLRSPDIVMGRLFPGSGIHQVEAPNLAPAGSKPPPPEFSVRRILVDPVTRPPSGFRPILTRRPVVRRKEPENLDYGTDIITIDDIRKQGSDRRKSTTDTFTRTVSSTLQVNTNRTHNRGRVFDDVIYDYPADGDNFKASETNNQQNRRFNRGQQLRWTRVTDSPSRYFYDVSPSGAQRPNNNEERHESQESKRDFWIVQPENVHRFY